MLDPVGLGHQLLGFFDRPDRVVQRIDLGENGQVHAVKVPSGEGPKAAIHAPPVLVTGRVEAHHVVFRVVEDGLEQGGAIVPHETVF